MGLRPLILLSMAALSGCHSPDVLSIVLDVPAYPGLSPLADARRTDLSLRDERTGMVLGRPISARSSSGETISIGELPAGSHDFLLSVTGDAQLLGVGRRRDVTLPLQDGAGTVTLALRKPFAFSGSAETLGLDPAPAIAIDTTLPPGQPPLLFLDSNATATASTSDGRYVFIADAGRVVVVRTADHSSVGTATIQPASGGGVPVVYALAVSRDDQYLTAVSDAGASIQRVDVLLQGTAVMPTTVLAGATKAAYAPGGSTVTVLQGARWQSLDCAAPPAATTVDLTLANGVAVGPARPAPKGTVDLEYDGGALLYATPCAAGVTDSDGKLRLMGHGIHDLVVAGPQRIGISDELAPIIVAVDPEDFSSTDVTLLPHGTVEISEPGGPQRQLHFLLPFNHVPLSREIVGPTIRLVATGLVVYDASLSPDGANLVFAGRLHYQAKDVVFNQVVNTARKIVLYCRFNVDEYVHATFQVDLQSATTHTFNRGLRDNACSIECFDCLAGPCNSVAVQDCRFANGDIPSDIHVLMGSQ